MLKGYYFNIAKYEIFIDTVQTRITDNFVNKIYNVGMNDNDLRPFIENKDVALIKKAIKYRLCKANLEIRHTSTFSYYNIFE